MKNIQSAIEKWIKNKDVSFVGSFVVFDTEGEVKDDESCIIGFGSRELIKLQIEELNKRLKKDKDSFVNW